jgi:hypothetical protein
MNGLAGPFRFSLPHEATDTSSKWKGGHPRLEVFLRFPQCFANPGHKCLVLSGLTPPIWAWIQKPATRDKIRSSEMGLEHGLANGKLLEPRGGLLPP